MPAHTTHEGSQHVEARHSPPHTSDQCTHPTHKLTTWHAHPWPPGHTAWPTSTPYAVCVGQCVGSVCGTPCACFAGSPHTASSATPWAALRANTKGQALAWDNLCTHTQTHPHTHGVARDAHPPCHSPACCVAGPPCPTQPAHVHTRARTLQELIFPCWPAALLCCPLSYPLLCTWPSGFHHGA